MGGYLDDIAALAKFSQQEEEVTEEVTHEFVCLNVLPLDLYAYSLEDNGVIAVSLTCPLGAQSELRRLELWGYELTELLFKELLTIRFVYCPPGISWSKTLESDARTFASKQPYSILT